MVGEIVCATKGSESGQHFYVIDEQGEYLLLANGKRRTLTAPKRKKRKHTVTCGEFDHLVTRRLQAGEPLCNRELRRALAAYRESIMQSGR